MGNNWSSRSTLGNFLLGKAQFNRDVEPESCLSFRGELMGKELLITNTPDLLLPNISQYKLLQHIEQCMRLSAIGPHLFLLVLQPETFTDDNKERFCRILEHISDRSFDHTLVVLTPSEAQGHYTSQEALEIMARKCRGEFQWKNNTELFDILRFLNKTLTDNEGQHISSDKFEEPTSPEIQVASEYATGFHCLHKTIVLIQIWS